MAAAVAGTGEAPMQEETAAGKGTAAAAAAVGGRGGGAAVSRSATGAQSRCQRFTVQDKTFNQQFSHVYTRRLQRMRERLRNAALARWGNAGVNSDAKEVPPIMEKIIDLSEGPQAEQQQQTEPGRCIILGTAYKEMPLKPNVLQEFRDDAVAAATAGTAAGGGIAGLDTEAGCRPLLKNLTSEEDELILEDETGRTELTTTTGAIDAHLVSTGVPLAVLGRVHSSGAFVVEDYVSCGIPPQHALDSPAQQQAQEATSRKMLFVSGLECGSGAANLEMQMLVEFVAGRLGGSTAHDAAAGIAHVVLAGNNVIRPDPTLLAERHLDVAKQETLAAPTKEFDILLAQLLTSASVLLMPGESDPANHLLPQQRLHPCLFPHSARFSSLQCVTNPADVRVNGKIILGTSGQNIHDLKRYTRIGKAPTTEAAAKGEQAMEGAGNEEADANPTMTADESLGMLQACLEWAHLCPSSPDTLACYPFFYDDPFILDECPHILFAGNQDSYGARAVRGPDGQRALLVSVPCFSTSHQAVLVDLDTLAAEPVSFDVRTG